MEASQPAVLVVSIWEIARKLRIGKLLLPCDQPGVLVFVQAVCKRHQIILEPLAGEVCETAELLPPHHEVPIDRMIIALASRSNCPVFTTDKKFFDYPVPIISQR